MLLVEGGTGDETFVGGRTAGGGPGDTGDADAKPENSSATKRSFEIAVVTDGCVNAKFNPFDGARTGAMGGWA
jgi:hypothetical protein